MHSISQGSLSFAKLVMMSSTPAKSAGDARYASQDPFIQRCPIQSRLQSVLGVHSLPEGLDSSRNVTILRKDTTFFSLQIKHVSLKLLKVHSFSVIAEI